MTCNIHILLILYYYFTRSIWTLPNYISSWIILANYEDRTTIARNPRAADAHRFSPNHLSVVPALMTCCTSVTIIVVVLFLVHPCIYRIRCREGTAAAPEDVLAVGPTRVYELTVSDPLVSIVLGVGTKGVVPMHMPDAHCTASGVVSVDIVLWRILGVGELDGG